MRLCILCQKKRVKKRYDLFCQECYGGEFTKEIKLAIKILKTLQKYGLRKYLWKVMWILELIKIAYQEEHRNREERKHTIMITEQEKERLGIS